MPVISLFVSPVCAVRFSAAALIMMLATATGYAKTPTEAGLYAIRIADLRVASVGERLAIANVSLCTPKRQRTGLVLHDLRQYSAQTEGAARAAFQFEHDISVEGVVPGSPAERAGIGVNSGLLAMDGDPIMAIANSSHGDPFERMNYVLDEEERYAADGILTLDFLKDGRAYRKKIITEQGCAGRFQIVFEGSRNAFSDGTYIQIDGKMVDFVRDDEELSAVLAHELAHIILDHRRRLNSLRRAHGAFNNNDRRISIRATEDEADGLSLYLMANAGYDPATAIGFWDRLERSVGPSMFSDRTHAGRKERVAHLTKQLTYLTRLREQTPTGTALVPDWARAPFPKLP
jgi:hypothetical protein